MPNKRIEEVIELSKNMGLDFFPIIFETVERSTMFNICSYGLPVRFRHWSHGRSYDYQKTYGEMGYSKIYEVILNNNPSYAFMLDTNSEVQNLFIAMHCAGHSHFFKNNCLFQNTNRNMIHHAAEHANRIEDYIERYGFDKVERIIDIGLALDSHIDWNHGLHRDLYPGKKIKYKQKTYGEFSDIGFNTNKIGLEKQTINTKFPPRPERDLLWFFMNYAPLEEWEKDVLDIIREEAFYFYPQMMTKIGNEGFATYWHAEIMYNYKNISPEEYINFLRTHEKVVQPGSNPFNINPYYLGYKIFKDIEKRWDKSHGAGAGKKKVLEVARDEDDISFIRNYLTSELIEEMKLFTYGYSEDFSEFYRYRSIEIKSRMRDEVVESLIKKLYNGGAPKIFITDVGSENTLIMEHEDGELGTLDFRYAEKTLAYIWDLWAAPIELHVKDEFGERWKLCYDECGYYAEHTDFDLEQFEEDDEDDEPQLVFRNIMP